MPERTMMQAEIIAESSKAAPPAVVAAVDTITRDGLGPVGWVTIAYIALQAAYLLWKWWHDIRRARRESRP